MKNGFSLLEVLVVLVIVGIVAAVALPYYRNAVESSRLTEIVILWGRQKTWANGHNMSPEQAQKATSNLQKANLRYFTGEIICREKETPSELCWEAQFTPKNQTALQYKIITTHNFARLACVGLNRAGENFCESQSLQDTPQTIAGERAYWMK